MKRVVQTLDEILASLQPLQVEWQDDVAHRVVERLRNFPPKKSYVEDDVRKIIEGDKTIDTIDRQDFDDALLIIRSFLGLSKDQFSSALVDALGAGGAGLQRYKKDSSGYLRVLGDLGILDALVTEVNRPAHWTDTLIERLRSGRGSAISGQRRGRVAEDFAEELIRKVFGENGYDVRATFVGRDGKTAKSDFAIPSKYDPSIVVESKGFGATGSKMSDVIGDIRSIIAAKRTDTSFLFFTDGLTWKQRQSDLKKIIEHQRHGDITRIYTQSMAEQFEADLRTLKAEHGL